MAQDGRIYITISDTREPKVAPEGTPDEHGKDSSEILRDYAKHKFFNFAESQAKQIINYSISNIGNFQGDFQTQKEVQYAVNVANTVKGLGVSAYAGFLATGTMAGGMIGLGIAAAGLIVNTAYEHYSGNIQTNQQNRSIEQLAKLSGLSTLSNGSR